MKLTKTRTILLALILAFAGLPTQANPADEVAGQVVAHHDGERITLPLLSSDYKIDIDGTVATVELTQSFSNPSDVPLNARYLFPLNQNAAVFAMKVEVGNELIEAVIKEKSDAQKTFDIAKSEGKAAALLTQNRPNMFTQNIANLVPGMPIKVTLSYVQSVPKIDGEYSLVVPMIVAPRYGQAAVKDGGNANGWQLGNLPAYPDVAGLNLAKDQVKPRVTLLANIRAGMPIKNLQSQTHRLTITGDGVAKSAVLTKGVDLDNRDFVLRYALSGDSLLAGVLGSYGTNGGYASIVVEPPNIVPDAMVTPRELIFLIDTSGSQSGQPLDASKTFMSVALDALRPNDYFRIVEFESNIRSFANDAMPASSTNVKAGKRFVRNLTANGGTNIDAAIRASFATRRVAGTLPIVVFLSDGLVGNEADVIQRIRKHIGEARIYSFGVGTSVNRYLMDGVAKHGRGYARYIDPTDDASEVAVRFANDLKTPILTDIKIDWGSLDAVDATPSEIPDLFAGGSTRIFTRYKTGGEHKIKITGKVNGVVAELPIKIDLPSKTFVEKSRALELIWARNQIAAKTLDYNTGMGNKPQLKRDVIKLGLSHSLQSKFTSFVAVSKLIYNDKPDAAMTKDVALPKVAGMSGKAYPSAIAGSSTPEPETLLGLILAALFTGLRYWREIRKKILSFNRTKKGQINAT